MVVMGWYWRRGRVKEWEAEAGSMRNASPSNGVGDSARSVLEYVLGVQSYTPFERMLINVVCSIQWHRACDSTMAVPRHMKFRDAH